MATKRKALPSAQLTRRANGGGAKKTDTAKKVAKKTAKNAVAPGSKGSVPAKRASRAGNALDSTSVRFFLADDVRQELNGKVTAVGLYTDNTIVAEMAPEDPDPGPTSALMLSGIVIMANVSAVPGEHSYKLEVEPNTILPPTVVSPLKKLTTPTEGGSVNVIMRLMPLPLLRFGSVGVVLQVDGRPFRYSFDIRRRNKSAAAL